MVQLSGAVRTSVNLVVRDEAPVAGFGGSDNLKICIMTVGVVLVRFECFG